MRYFTVTEEELNSARPGLTLVERLMEDSSSFTPFLYGVTSKESILLSAGDALQDDIDEEDGETAPSVNEVALAIPMSAEALYLLTGSGLVLKNEEFAYRAGRDNVRMQWLNDRSGVRVTLGDFDTVALSDGDTYLDEFLKEYGINTGSVGADITVTRDEIAATRRNQTQAQPEETTPQHAYASARTASARPMTLNSIDNFLA
jgi:hypothetical protein